MERKKIRKKIEVEIKYVFIMCSVLSFIPITILPFIRYLLDDIYYYGDNDKYFFCIGCAFIVAIYVLEDIYKKKN